MIDHESPGALFDRCAQPIPTVAPESNPLTAALAAVLLACTRRTGAAISNAEACALRDLLSDWDTANQLPWKQAREAVSRG